MPVARFLQALDRARVIIRNVFGKREEIYVIISYIGEKVLGSEEYKQVRDLRRLGFQTKLSENIEIILERDKEFLEDFGDNSFRYINHIELKTTSPDIDTLIWACISRGINITPRSRFPHIYFVSIVDKIIAHIYDDRGMDIVGMEYNSVREFYVKFNDWLFDYDRLLMDTNFL
jgi:hypothetical protein